MILLAAPLETVSVLVRDTVRTVAVNPSSAWDRLWPVLLGGALTAVGGFAAQSGRAWLDERKRREHFVWLITAEIEAIVVHLREWRRDIDEGRWCGRYELEQIEQIRAGYDRQRAEVVLVTSRERQHEIAEWYRALRMLCDRVRQGNEIAERLTRETATPYVFPRDKLEPLRRAVESQTSKGLNIIREMHNLPRDHPVIPEKPPEEEPKPPTEGNTPRS